ncbi:MAG: hypothetical protein JSW11_15845 [Candidatus Heimdallarchaeota archaeon]|nr:MAG: hypothetical protein JSW11_15845 [Candidatus Heimdallarchaeota archaeon]
MKTEIINRIIETLLEKIEAKDQEQGRLLVHDDFEQFDSRINLWAVRENVRDLKETTITDMTNIPDDVEIKVTYAPPSFFSDVLGGKENVPYWQVATVMRILRDSDIIYDPHGKMQLWMDQAPHIEWDPNLIDLKRQTTQLLLDRMNNRIKEDMFADAYIWLIKAAEEAICVPLMQTNAFKIGTATLLLDVLRDFDDELYTFFADLLRISSFDYEKLEKARKELETLADHLYKVNVRTNREMWILAAFVSINESERRLNQCQKSDTKVTTRLFETAVAELWQAYWLVAQNPRSEVKLDPWVVGSFWNHFGFNELDANWLLEQKKKVKELLPH